MSLLNFPKNRTTLKQDKKLIKKANSRSQILQPTFKVSGNGSITDKINAINATITKEYRGKEDNYQIINQEDILLEYFDKAASEGIMTLDTETTSLNPITCTMAGFSIYTPGLKPAYVPINHVSYISSAKVSGQLDQEFCSMAISQLSPKIKLGFHNAKFDLRVILNQLKVNLFPYLYWCTQIASHILDENEPHDLKYLHTTYCDPNTKNNKYSQLFDGIPFTYIPIKSGYIYAARDALMTYELMDFQRKYLEIDSEICKQQNLQNLARIYRDLEIPLVASLIQMEQTGISLDTKYVEDLSKQLHTELKIRETKFRDVCKPYEQKIKKYRISNSSNCKLSDPILISSPEQISILLYDIAEVKPVSKKAPRSTDAKILKKIDNEICRAVMDYREVMKLLSTYVDKMPKEINSLTGKIHASFNQTGTVTNRLSSSDPNLQNIPVRSELGSKIRKMFCADKGNCLLFPDYSQQEPRILAYMSKDEKMIEAYRQGKDLYAFMGAHTFKVPYEDCLEKFANGEKHTEGKKRRDRMKAIVLGVMYDRTAVTIAEELKIKTKEAEKILDMFFDAFPDVQKFRQESLDFAFENGYVEMLWGRKRRLPELLLDKYEFTRIGEGDNFDPTDFDSDEQQDLEIDDETIDMYWEALENCWSYKKKIAILSEARSNGIKIVDNSLKIDETIRQVVNSRIQGSAGIMVKNAMVKCNSHQVAKMYHISEELSKIIKEKYLERSTRLDDLQAKLVIQVHDELIMTTRNEYAKEVSLIVSSIMLDAAAEMINVPMKVDVDISDRWNGDKINV